MMHFTKQLARLASQTLFGKEDFDGSGTCHEKTRATLQESPQNGHHRMAKGTEEDQRKPGEELSPANLRALERPGVKWKRLPRTELNGDLWLQPYAPPGAKRISK